MSRRWPVAPAVATAVLLAQATLPDSTLAQSFRVTGSSSLRYVEVRPLVRDSIPAAALEGGGYFRQTPDGRVLRCMPGDTFCRGTRPGDAVGVIPAMQDVELSGWGFGEGMGIYVHARGRQAWGADPEIWPRADEPLDILTAYGELDRDRFRVRAGRQFLSSGLGYYNFDGLAVTARPRHGLAVEGYAGRSLVRGLNEPRTGGAVQAIEGLAPEQPGVLFGIEARYRPDPRTAWSATYHRDIRRDRGVLYSERAAADGVLRFGDGAVEGSLEVDVATATLNLARLRVRAPPIRQMLLQGQVRRYRPYFELWTIWGAFSPVGFDEARVDLTWARPAGDIILRGDASYRAYHDAGATGGLGGVRTDGLGAGGHVSWVPRTGWRSEASYGLEVGFGASRSEGFLGLIRQFGEAGFVAVRATAFQRLYEFRLDEGVVVGGGADASFRLTNRTRASGGVAAYRHLHRGSSAGLDWTQLRAGLTLGWILGAEPAVAAPPAGIR